MPGTESLMTNRTGPLLQLAIDCLTTGEALTILDEAYPCFDIAEVGTPLLVEEGLSALEALQSRHGDKQYLADTKIMDGGRIEACSAFRRGADLATVLAVADDVTIREALDAAREQRGQVMVDLINAPDPVERARQLEQMGAEILCLHTAYDLPSAEVDSLADLERTRRSVSCTLAIAGGIDLDRTNAAMERGADIIIVGGAITNHPDRREAASAIYELLKRS